MPSCTSKLTSGLRRGKKRDARHDRRNGGRCDAEAQNPLFADLCDLKLRRFHVLEQVGGAVVQQFSGFGQADALAGAFK